MPLNFPRSRNSIVRIFDATSTTGKVIEAAHYPGEREDTILRESIDGDARSILEQVRRIVEV